MHRERIERKRVKQDTLMLGQAAPAGNIKVSRKQRRSFEMRHLRRHSVAVATALGVIVTLLIWTATFAACSTMQCARWRYTG